MQREQRRLAAIVSADVAGYSRLMEADEAGTLATFKRHREELIEPKIRQFGGRIVGAAGDGLLIEFGSVVDAVQSAVEVQQGMDERNAEIEPSRRMELRVGVNLGDVIVDGADIHGDGVNVAARLQQIAAAGGVCIAGTVREHIAGKLPYAFDDAGEQQVKNIARAVRVFRLRRDRAEAAPTLAVAAGDLPLPSKPSVVVLPFTNMSGDPEQEYFSDGITEDITTELARFSELFVIARNTAMTFKGRNVDVKRVASDLGVEYVLEGSVRKLGGRVRISVQLIDGRDGNHVWAERYDGAVEDIFALQDDVTPRVATAAGAEIKYAQQRRAGRGTRNFDAAHDMVWRARRLFDESLNAGNPSLMRQAIELADQARQINRDCLPAYAQVCLCASINQLYGWATDRDANLGLAERAASELWARAPQDYASFFARGRVKLMQGDFDAGLADTRRAFELNPNDSFVIVSLAWAEASAGEIESARDHAQLFLRLSPRDRWIGTGYLALAMSSFIDRDIAATHHWAQLAVQHLPTAPIRRALMVACGAEAGDRALVREHLDFLAGFAPDFIPSLYHGHNPVFRREDHMRLLLDALRKAEAMMGEGSPAAQGGR